MSKGEHSKEHEEEVEGEIRGIKAGLTLGSVTASAFGLLVAAGNFTAKIFTGDILGAAEGIGSALSVMSKAAGLSPLINKAGEYFKEKIGDSKISNFVGKAWKVATSRPVKMGLKIAGIGLAIAAGLSNPVSASLVALSAGAMAVSTVIGSRNIGRNQRIEQETKGLNEAADKIKKHAKDKIPALDTLLATKLAKNKVQEVDGAKVGASVARGSIIESAALILEAVSDAENPLIGAAVAGVAIFGGLADEAKEAIERQEKRNRILFNREEARAKVVCATLATEPGIDKLSPEALEEKYNDVYKANFQQSLGTKVKNFFKDIRSGSEEYIFGALKKVFAKTEVHATDVDAHAKQQAVEITKGPKQERTADVVATPPAHSRHHGLDPHYMETHTHIDKNEHGPHLSEGGGKAVAQKAKAR